MSISSLPIGDYSQLNIRLHTIQTILFIGSIASREESTEVKDLRTLKQKEKRRKRRN